MKQFHFWRKWLVVTGIYLVAFGLALAAFPQSNLMDLFMNNQIDPIFALDDNSPLSTKNFQAWIYGLLGAMVASWGLLIASIANFAFKPGEKWAWYSILFAVLLWFIVDQVISLYYSVLFNVAFNALLFAVLMLPLLFTRSYFFKRQI